MARVRQRLFIMRHAETETITDEGRLQSDGMVVLTDRGWAMARALRPFFEPLRLQRMHSSDLLRAIQTAQGAGGEGVPVIPHQRLREVSLGDAEGADARSAFAAVPGYLRDPDVGMPGGETPRQVLARGSRELEAILDAEADEPAVAVVGHGCLNRMLLAHLLGLDISRALRLRQDWTGVNVLERCDRSWQLGALNWNPSGMAEFSRTRGVAGVAPEVWQRLGR
jgi:broad specificity phosphatase PhoE